ncbi:MAG TPA: histidine kinase [Solirubrobacteraceae bacterium]|nr:histidine kinase [Solirubrobacteraceae bacterium]
MPAIARRRRVTGGAFGTHGFPLALWQLAVAITVLGAVEFADGLQAQTGPWWVLLLFAAVGVEYGLAGILAWSRRPSNGIGALLCLGGLTLLGADLQNTGPPALVAAGLILGQAPIAVILHILLAFPSGRLRGRRDRALVLAGYLVTIAIEPPQYLFTHVSGPGGVLQVANQPDLIEIDRWIQRGLGAMIIVATAFVLASRLRRATPLQRRVLALLYSYGIAAILFLELAVNVLGPLFDWGPITVFVLQISALAGIPVAFVLGVFRGDFARTAEIDELGTWLGARDGARPALREALAQTLGDDSVELLFWLPERDRYVDAGGQAAELPEGRSGRAAVEIELGGSLVGAIAYDAVLIVEPELVRAAGRVIALALERERLTAELLASHDALLESRARIVEATDRERRRIARDLHDGLQAQLVLLAVKVGQIAPVPADAEVRAGLAELRAGLEGASDELRRLVQGVMPALLIERGLFAAAEDLVDRMPVPTRLHLTNLDGALPQSVESAGFFVIAEALTNAVKHSRANELAVSLERVDGRLMIEVRDDGVGGARVGGGTGLRGIADRVDVLGGRLLVESPPGEGTRLHAEVPCAS